MVNVFVDLHPYLSILVGGNTPVIQNEEKIREKDRNILEKIDD